MEVKTLIQQYQKNSENIKKIKETHDRKEKARDKKIYHIEWKVYRKKIQALEQERDKEINGIIKEYEKSDKNKDERIENLSRVIYKVDRIREFLRIQRERSKNNLKIKNKDVKQYKNWGNNKYLEWLGYIFNDDLLKIKLLIVENDKPKNKFSLCAYGKTIFTEKNIEFPYTYSIHLNENSGFSLKINLKDAPTIEELKTHLEKNKEHILAYCLRNYEAIKKEYLETISKYKPEDFKQLYKYYCRNCNYSLTEHESKRVNLGPNNQCPQCQHKLIENKLKTE